MTNAIFPVLTRLQALLQGLTLFCVTVVAIGLSVATALAVLEVIAWPYLPLTWNGAPLPDAGQWALIGLTALFVGLCFFLPSHARIHRLEVAHRDFTLTMEDVARAYYAAHSADRARKFRLSSEFDSIKERMIHMRDHPDLGHLEPEILELAAQMSHQARDLAEIYSEAKVARARTFLMQRQQEIEDTRVRISEAQQVCREFKRWVEEVDLEESVLQSQIDMLRDEFSDIFDQPSKRRREREPLVLRTAAE